MRKHIDPQTGELCSVTITRSEWRQRRRGRRWKRRRERPYIWTRCDVRGRVAVYACVVADGSPEARRDVRA